VSSERERVLVADPISDDGVEELRRHFEVDVHTGQTGDQLLGRIGDYEALVVRSETKVRAEHIEAARRLRVIGRAGVGVDNIDVEAASRAGILVVNAPAGNTIAAAEHTVAMMMALARHIPQANRSLLEDKWDRKSFMGFQLRGKTLGVIGLGAIGGEVAKRAQGLEMEVIAFDPVVTPDRAEQINVELVDLDELCRRSDVITVHVPLVAATKHLFDARRIAACKPGVRLVNVARGGVYDEAAVVAALDSGQVAGAAFDVFETEPPACRFAAGAAPQRGRHASPGGFDRGGPGWRRHRRRRADRLGAQGRAGAVGGQRPHGAARGDARPPALPGAG